MLSAWDLFSYFPPHWLSYDSCWFWSPTHHHALRIRHELPSIMSMVTACSKHGSISKYCFIDLHNKKKCEYGPVSLPQWGMPYTRRRFCKGNKYRKKINLTHFTQTNPLLQPGTCLLSVFQSRDCRVYPELSRFYFITVLFYISFSLTLLFLQSTKYIAGV